MRERETITKRLSCTHYSPLQQQVGWQTANSDDDSDDDGAESGRIHYDPSWTEMWSGAEHEAFIIKGPPPPPHASLVASTTAEVAAAGV